MAHDGQAMVDITQPARASGPPEPPGATWAALEESLASPPEIVVKSPFFACPLTLHYAHIQPQPNPRNLYTAPAADIEEIFNERMEAKSQHPLLRYLEWGSLLAYIERNKANTQLKDRLEVIFDRHTKGLIESVGPVRVARGIVLADYFTYTAAQVWADFIAKGKPTLTMLADILTDNQCYDPYFRRLFFHRILHSTVRTREAIKKLVPLDWDKDSVWDVTAIPWRGWHGALQLHVDHYDEQLCEADAKLAGEGQPVWVDIARLRGVEHWKSVAEEAEQHIRSDVKFSIVPATDLDPVGYRFDGESVVVTPPESLEQLGVPEWTDCLRRWRSCRAAAAKVRRLMIDAVPELAKTDIADYFARHIVRCDLCEKPISKYPLMLDGMLCHEMCAWDEWEQVGSTERQARSVDQKQGPVDEQQVQPVQVDEQQAMVDVVHSRGKRGAEVVEGAVVDEGPLERRTRARTAAVTEEKDEQEQGPEEEDDVEDQGEEDVDAEEEDDEQDDPSRPIRSQMTTASP